MKGLLVALLVVVSLTLCASRTPPPPGFLHSPAGYLHESCVHRVPNGGAVRQLENGTYFVESPAGHASESYFVPRCEHRWKPSFENNNNNRTKTWRMFGPDDDGWSAYAITINNGNTVVTGQFTAPSGLPAANNQLIYIFLGLMDGGSYGVMMSTVQYGVGLDGGGPYFMAASWYIESSGIGFFHDPVEIQPSYVMQCSITQVDSQEWNIVAGPSYMHLYVGVPTMTQVCAVAEIWDDLNSCGWPQGQSVFTNIAATDGVDMQPYDKSSCGLTVDIPAPNAVTINYLP